MDKLSKEEKKIQKKKQKKEKKEKHEIMMKQLPPTAYSCATHQGQYLRVYAKQQKSPPQCKCCGIKLEGKSGYLCCPKVMSCFLLCSVCRICPKNHPLRNVISLKHLVDDPLNSVNKIKCNGCKEQKIIDAEKGVLFCGVCKFGVCAQCYEKSESLWQTPQNDDLQTKVQQ